jgi:hypothetical protein
VGEMAWHMESSLKYFKRKKEEWEKMTDTILITFTTGSCTYKIYYVHFLFLLYTWNCLYDIFWKGYLSPLEENNDLDKGGHSGEEEKHTNFRYILKFIGIVNELEEVVKEKNQFLGF